MNTRLVGTALAAAVLFSPPAWSTQLLGPATTSVTIGGQLAAPLDQLTTAQTIIPWTAEVFSEAHQCLRLSVTLADDDVEMTVVAPNGKVWRDDDSGGFFFPLVKIADAPVKGYYSVRIAHYNGLPANGVFTLKAERLPKTFASCNPPTVALVNGP